MSQQLIDKMSDPVNELGKFIQTLSVNKSISMELDVDDDNMDDDNKENQGSQNIDFIQGMKEINREKEKWQELLSENWHISKQNKSLVPLIRFLYQILSPPDFNHIMPLCNISCFVCTCSERFYVDSFYVFYAFLVRMMSGVRILQIIFYVHEGKLYRNMLFESIESETKRKHNHKHKKRRKKKKRKKGKEEDLDFMEGMIKAFGFSHLFEIEKASDNKQKNKNENENETANTEEKGKGRRR